MSQATIEAERVRIDDPVSGMSQFAREAERQIVPVAAAAQSAVDQAEARIITAQRVAVKRSMAQITAEIAVLATAAGDAMYYSWEAEDKETGRKSRIEGPSIDCAMMLVGAYGNCSIEAFPAKETQTHYVFLARFVDYEKGVTVTRSFQQRKAQNVGGRMDRGRAEDIVFQIGQSKAMRNAVVGALKMLADFAVNEAKKGVLARVEKNPEAARAWLLQVFADHDIALARVERAIGRPAARWAVEHIARLYAEVQSIKDGYAFPDDLWPPLSAADAAAASQAAVTTAAEKPAPKVTKPRTAPAKTEPTEQDQRPSGDGPVASQPASQAVVQPAAVQQATAQPAAVQQATAQPAAVQQATAQPVQTTAPAASSPALVQEAEPDGGDGGEAQTPVERPGEDQATGDDEGELEFQ